MSEVDALKTILHKIRWATQGPDGRWGVAPLETDEIIWAESVIDEKLQRLGINTSCAGGTSGPHD